MSFYTFMPKLFNMSMTAGVAIVFVILLRLLLKKAPKAISYALWGVVLFRLLCPVSVESGYSLYNLLDAPTEESGTMTSIIEYVPVDIVHTEYPAVVLPVPGGSNVINDVLPQGEEQLRADPLEGPIFIATYVWMTGVLVMTIYSIVSYVQLRRKLAVAVPLQDNIFVADDIKSPFVVGLFRPRIYLPCNLGENEQKYIILHEQHHIRRCDHIIKVLAFFALAIHWFNPLVWAAFILASKDMEMSCDEAVIRKAGSDVRADYSASLLTLATGRRIIAGTPLAFGEGDTKGRINNLSKWKKPKVWIVLMAVIVCVVLAVCLLTNPETKQDLSFLNYENLVSIAAETDTHPASKSEDQGRYIIGGSQLAKFLDLADWTAQTGISRNVQRDTDKNSKASIQITLDGVCLKVFDTDTANIYDGNTGKDRYYRMCDGDYEKLLAMLSLDNEYSADVTKWFDYLDAPNEMQWDGSLEIDIPEFPNVTLRWSYGEMVAVKGNEVTSLYTGMPIWNTYFCDLTGDGFPELCSTISWGSGMIDNRVIIYDYANGASYSLQDRGRSNYRLRQDERGGQLYVDKNAYFGGGLLSTGQLVFKDSAIQILGQTVPNDAIREIIDPTNDPNFAYDTAVEKIYEDKNTEYFLSGLYSQYVIVQYADGTQEDIAAALNSGRATIADLDKFNIRYWAEPKPTAFAIAENTVAEIGRGTLKAAVELTGGDAAKLLSLAESGNWVQAAQMPAFDIDCALNLGGRLLYYCSKDGTLIEFNLSEMTTISHQTPSGGRYWTMAVADQLFVNNILCGYIDLTYGITDVPAPDYGSGGTGIEYGDTLDAAISAATLKRYASDEPDGLLHVESHVILHQETEQTGKVTVFAMSLLDKYGFAGAAFHEVESWYEPIKMTFEYREQRGYRLSDSWFPARPAGSWDALAKEIYEQFSMCSEDLADSVLLELLDENDLVRRKQDCYDQAVRYGGVDTDRIAEQLFDAIESSFVTPFTTTSRPQDYVAVHLGEYRELIYYGNYTLRYVFSRFLEGGQTGLRGHLMREVLDDLAPEARLRLYAETGQEYFDAWKAAAIRVGEQQGVEWIRENQPAVWLLLQMING